jgi:hypothetical protein
MDEEIYERCISLRARSSKSDWKERRRRIAAVSGEDAAEARTWRRARTHSSEITVASAALHRVLAHAAPPEILDDDDMPVEYIEDVPEEELAEIYGQALGRLPDDMPERVHSARISLIALLEALEGDLAQQHHPKVRWCLTRLVSLTAGLIARLEAVGEDPAAIFELYATDWLTAARLSVCDLRRIERSRPPKTRRIICPTGPVCTRRLRSRARTRERREGRSRRRNSASRAGPDSSDTGDPASPHSATGREKQTFGELSRSLADELQARSRNSSSARARTCPRCAQHAVSGLPTKPTPPT